MLPYLAYYASNHFGPENRPNLKLNSNVVLLSCSHWSDEFQARYCDIVIFHFYGPKMRSSFDIERLGQRRLILGAFQIDEDNETPFILNRKAIGVPFLRNWFQLWPPQTLGTLSQIQKEFKGSGNGLHPTLLFPNLTMFYLQPTPSALSLTPPYPTHS